MKRTVICTFTMLSVLATPLAWSETNAGPASKQTAKSVSARIDSLFNESKLQETTQQINTAVDSFAQDTAMKLKYEIYKSKLPQERQEKLEIAHSAWLTYRDASVAFVNSTNAPDAKHVAGQVYVEMTKGHTKVLEDLLQELQKKK